MSFLSLFVLINSSLLHLFILSVLTFPFPYIPFFPFFLLYFLLSFYFLSLLFPPISFPLIVLFLFSLPPSFCPRIIFLLMTLTSTPPPLRGRKMVIIYTSGLHTCCLGSYPIKLLKIQIPRFHFPPEIRSCLSHNGTKSKSWRRVHSRIRTKYCINNEQLFGSINCVKHHRAMLIRLGTSKGLVKEASTPC